MNITEVRVKLMRGRSDRLRAFCSITIDDDFVVHDLRVIEGRKGFFVAMPSRKLTDNCPKCGGKNELRAKYCNECGNHLGDERARRGDDEKIHVDVAHPIHTECREEVQSRVLDAYDEELARVKAEEEGEEAEAPEEREPEEEHEEEEFAECEEAPGYAEEVEAEEEEEYETVEEEMEEEAAAEQEAPVEEEAAAEEEAEVEPFGPPLEEEPEEAEEAEEPIEARGGAIRVEQPSQEIMEKEEDTGSALESSLAEDQPYPGPAPYEEELEEAEEAEEEPEPEEEEEEEGPKPSPDRHERRDGGFGEGIL
ncbi:MAG: SpoVG family protein [Planctomycetota bacterium]